MKKQGTIASFFGGAAASKKPTPAPSEAPSTPSKATPNATNQSTPSKVESSTPKQNLSNQQTKEIEKMLAEFPVKVSVAQPEVEEVADDQASSLNKRQLVKNSKRKQLIEDSDEENNDSQSKKEVQVPSNPKEKVQELSGKKLKKDDSQLSTKLINQPTLSNEKQIPNKKNPIPQAFPSSLKPETERRSLLDQHFDPIRDAPFLQGQDVPFSYLCDGFEKVGEQQGKNSKGAMIDIMSRIFKSIILLCPAQVYEAYMFCILKIAPDYEPNELGVGREILQKAISTCCGKSVSQVRESFNKLGDLGKVACQAKSTQKNISSFFTKTEVKKPPITLIRAFSDLRSIASSSGQNSTAKREGFIIKFMNEAKPDEICYFIRFIEMNLKIGAAEKTMQAALSKAFFDLAYSDNDLAKMSTEQIEAAQTEFNFTITRCLCEFPNYKEAINSLMKVGKDINQMLDLCKITIGVPCKPMLAKPTKSIQVILERFKDMEFTCEYKYDGLRGQIHFDGKDVTIFSRNLENMTLMYPDIVEFVHRHVQKSKNISNFILDSEIVAFDRKTNRIKPFQSLATRGRVNVKLDEIDIKVCVFMFDLILINDTSLLQSTLKERRQAIVDHFVQEPGEFCFAEHLNTEDQEEIQEFLEKSVKVGCEGLMVKTLTTNSTYEPAKRSFKWLKLKKDYIDNGLGDTFDLVPIAALKGAGKRAGLYGAYLLACYNEDMERYETICKIGTGFSDEALEACFKFFQDKIIPSPQSDYLVKDFKADVWFTPSVVWEIKGADLQISPVYTSAISETNQEKGIGLRFPRLVKIRDDKEPNEATSPSFIYDLYKQQAVVANDFDDADDFY